MPDLRHVRHVLTAAAMVLPSTALAQGAVSTSDEVTIRLVAEAPQSDGRFRAAIVLDLAPEWKTYWLDPGDAGLPPRIALSGVGLDGEATVRYPAPVRFEEAGSRSTGYVAPVGFGVTGRVDDPLHPGTLHADVAIGVCRTVCIPVSASLTLDVPAVVAATSDPLVDWTFAGLPRRDASRFGASLSADRETLHVAAGSNGVGADLFAAGPEGWSFGPADRRPDGTFDLPVLSRPTGEVPSLPAVDLVLVDGETTIEGKTVPVDIR